MYEVQKAPLPVAGVLDRGFSLYKAALPKTFVIALVVAAIWAPMSALFTKSAVLGSAPALPLPLPVLVLAVLIIEFCGWGAIIACIDAAARGENLAFGPALKLGLRRGAVLFAAVILVSLAIGVGYLLLIVPGVYLTIMLIFTMIAAVAERTGPVESLKYSWRLVRGHWWRTAGVTGVVTIIGGVLYALIAIIGGAGAVVNPQGVLARGGLPWYVQYLVVPVFEGLVVPFVYSMLVALYYDLKLRREGSDIAARITAVQA
ncbi:MAG TPA: hypothetical protein VFY39_10845 [Gammaproteobacteria bacterium]|nr:hypothetical protein [Gammaproteobacteria bacterium]